MDLKDIEKSLFEKGIAEIGYANLTGIVPTRYNHLPYGISLVYRLANGIVDELEILNKPSFTYFQHYRAINSELDSMGLWLCTMIERMGYKAIAIGASQSVHDMGNYSGAFQHKTVAVQSGLGFIGKSALFVSHKNGPRVRLVSILTDMPLDELAPKEIEKIDYCKNCTRCTDICPSGAISGKSYLESNCREDFFDAQKCSKYMKNEFMQIGRGSVCGLCMAVCPYGKKK